MFLLGFSKEKEVVFGSIEIRGGALFASFDTVAPFLNKKSDGIEYFSEMLNDCYSNSEKFELCKKLDCKPSELVRALVEKEGVNTLADERDCSIYSERLTVDGNEWAFESSSSGQHDILEDGMLEFVNKKDVMELYTLWKAYHLKKVDDTIVEQVAQLRQKLDIGVCEEEAIIASYIKKYCQTQ